MTTLKKSYSEVLAMPYVHFLMTTYHLSLPLDNESHKKITGGKARMPKYDEIRMKSGYNPKMTQEEIQAMRSKIKNKKQ